MTEHPDFLAVDPVHRWTKPLNELFPVLRKVAWNLRGGWAWRVLPHGAMVSVRIVPPEEGKESAFTLELRIARRTPPADVEGWRKWSTELAVFLKHMSGESGDWKETSRSTEKAEATFRFVVKGPVLCDRCGKREAADVGQYKEDLCVVCAREAGDREAQENNAAHQQEKLL